jgi:Hydrazine synthase alpha subunit middle domain
MNEQIQRGILMNTRTRTNAPLIALSAILLGVGLAGCGSSGSDSTSVTVNGDVPIAYVKRSSAITMNPTDGTSSAPGGDLMLREKSSSSAPEYNLTAQFTQGVGDASDPEVSYDGKKIVFSMKCPTSNTSKIGDVAACTGAWNIWEYDMTVGGLTGGTFRRLTSASDSDDVDPAYLPAGRGFVFSSNRQTKSKTLQAIPGQTYYALDEYERERVLNLHTMDATGAAITQISFNQSHDRNPVVRPNGDIMFSRWEHVGPRNRFAIFRTKPDGTDMFVLYGAQSPGNSFLHPRDMDPAGKYKGFVSSDLMSLSRTQEGGSLMFIDAAKYSENNTPANKSVDPVGGQTEVTEKALNQGRGVSMFGRITTPYPLWDGSNRVLVGYHTCEVSALRDGAWRVIPCIDLTADEKAKLNDDQRLDADRVSDTARDDVPAAYAIYMYDPGPKTLLIVAAPPAGFMYTDPVALQARAEPNAIDPTAIDATLAAQGMALIEVRSVYDTDGLGRMGEGMLAAVDRPAGCTAGIAMTTPSDTMDTRQSVADLARMKDPADAAYGCAPVRFVRATRAVAPPSSTMGLRSAIGETEFEQVQILGYAPIEPDGSFKLKVPADVPLAFSVVDAKGRGIQTHLNWIQVRPGERRTCDGCHSPRRGGALNSGAIVNALPAALLPSMSSAHQSGETLAALRTRLDATALNLKPDMAYTDVWADTSKAGVTALASISVKYTGNASAADDLATPAPVNGLINYPDHIAPLWTRTRGTNGANTCATCHTDSKKLDLRATIAGTGRVTSYEELLLGDPVIDAFTGLPVTRVRDGVPEVVRDAALVETMSGNAAGMARSSRLAEIMFGETLKAGADATAKHPNPPATAPNHALMLNAAEKRLITEWMDLGGQYYNNPFDGGVKSAVGLSQAVFAAQVFPILRSTCAASCHQAIGSDPSVPVGSGFRQNRFVLTGSPEGDYNVTLSMISDTCKPASNYLLSRPSTVPHPAGATGQLAAVLPLGSAKYTTIANWISGGCP